MKAKIIVEIDGERHRMVSGRAGRIGNICSKCSLVDLCSEEIGSPCLDSRDYFVKEKKQIKGE